MVYRDIQDLVLPLRANLDTRGFLESQATPDFAVLLVRQEPAGFLVLAVIQHNKVDILVFRERVATRDIVDCLDFLGSVEPERVVILGTVVYPDTQDFVDDPDTVGSADRVGSLDSLVKEEIIQLIHLHVLIRMETMEPEL